MNNNMSGTVHCISFPEDLLLNLRWLYEQKFVFVVAVCLVVVGHLSASLLCMSAFMVVHETVNRLINFIHHSFCCLTACHF
jgi:hypothetical protein